MMYSGTVGSQLLLSTILCVRSACPGALATVGGTVGMNCDGVVSSAADDVSAIDTVQNPLTPCVCKVDLEWW